MIWELPSSKILIIPAFSAFLKECREKLAQPTKISALSIFLEANLSKIS